jgi:CRISPR-associated endonuclease Cas1 subtype I-E
MFVEKGRLDVLDGAFVMVDEGGIRTHIPVGGIVCLMLEPGTRVSHAAVALAARAGTLLIWVGEAGVRLYAAGQPGGARADRLLLQARLALDDDARLRVVRKMYSMRFGEEAPARRSIDQLRGIEGARVRETYRLLAQRHGAQWNGRAYDPTDWSGADGHGGPHIGRQGMRDAVKGICRQVTGSALGPHDFRGLVAKIHLHFNPGDYGTVMHLLGHLGEEGVNALAVPQGAG